MLRFPQAVATLDESLLPTRDDVGVSLGTAAVLGLRRLRQDDAPTTAYILLGKRCTRDCAFCTRARHSTARAALLSRVAWPCYPGHVVQEAVQRGFEQGDIVRCCIQVTVFPGYVERTVDLVSALHHVSAVPICTSIFLTTIQDVVRALSAGAQRVTLALDAATQALYGEAKSSGWDAQVALLLDSARRFPGRIGTHLIVELGETEREMILCLQHLVDCGVTVGLFAFTPIRGTRWEGRPAPELSHYRRIQATYYLMKRGLRRVEELTFSADGRLRSLGVGRDELEAMLSDGCAFETSGCAGCNRPCYNEHPGQTAYNYPRALSLVECTDAVALLNDELTW